MSRATPNSLPPGMALSQPVLGTLHLKATHLIWLANYPKDKARVLLKFWGETQKQWQVIRPAKDTDDALARLPQMASYVLRCQPLQLRQYLVDMKSVRIDLVSLENKVIAAG